MVVVIDLDLEFCVLVSIILYHIAGYDRIVFVLPVIIAEIAFLQNVAALSLSESGIVCLG